MAVEIPLKNIQIPDEFGLIDRRVTRMENTFKGGDRLLNRKRKLLPHLLIRAIELWVISEAQLLGKENLDFIRDKKQVTIALNHTSDTDHGVLEYALIANKYADVADRLLFAAGLKMWDRWQTVWGMWGMNDFPTATPGYFEDASVLLNQQLSDGQTRKVEQYIQYMNKLNKSSLRAILPDWKSGKKIVVVYPETTRSRKDGLLQKGKEETNIYFKRSWILPVNLQGSHDVFPPGQMPDWGKVFRRELQATVIAGEPINAERLQAPDTRKWLEDRGTGPVDFVMSRIAALNFDRVDPEYKPLYLRLREDIPEGLVLKAA